MAAPEATNAGPVLRDIHMPPPPTWWPPAPGWWLLALVLLVLVATAVWFVWRWRKRRRLWLSVRKELDSLAAQHAIDGDRAALAAGLSQLLRRATIHGGGDAHLQGAAWRAQVERIAPGLLSAETLTELDRATYQKRPVFNVDLALHGCRCWLRKALHFHA